MLLRIGVLVACVALTGCATRSERRLHTFLQSVCWPEDGESAAFSTFERSGEAGRRVLLRMAQSRAYSTAECGIGALSLIGDTRVVPSWILAMRRWHDDPITAKRLYRWASVLAGFPQPQPGSALWPLLDVVEADLSGALAVDALSVLGDIGHPRARALLRAGALKPAAADGTVAVAVRGLARQGDGSALTDITALAQRAPRPSPLVLESVAFYFMALGPSTASSGLDVLQQLDVRTQVDLARLTVRTL